PTTILALRWLEARMCGVERMFTPDCFSIAWRIAPILAVPPTDFQAPTDRPSAVPLRLGLAPDDTHLLDTRGTILSSISDRLTDARKDFERLVPLLPSDTRQQARALLQLGRVCAKLNDLAQAKQHLQKVLEIARKALEINPKMDIFTADERSEITRIIQQAGE
ncbi:MAG: tetratricopeptide repeat protein, partial [Phycisphaerae bacterium]|nr:tetratricopeptide repeat protein [Phycisphaerae bacterium]